MRKIYTLAAAVIFACAANAQTEVYFDDFESNSLEGYTLYNLDGLVPDAEDLASLEDSAWTVMAIGAQGWPHGLSAFSVSWYVGDEGPSDDWLVTPAIDIAGEAILSWDALAITSTGDFRDRYIVYISTSSDLEVIGNEAIPVFDTGAIGEETTPTPRMVDLAAEGFENQTIYICFRNNTQPFGSNPGGPGNGGNELAIDNIRVTDNSEPVSVTDTEVFRDATVSPNPAASGTDVAVTFSLERPERVFVEVTDISGKVISVENRGVMSSGNHIIHLGRNDLATGIYMVRLRTEHASRVMKVVFE